MTTPRSGYQDHFGVDNIPFGIASIGKEGKPSTVTRYQDQVIFLQFLHHDLFSTIDGLPHEIFQQSTLNAFAALDPNIHLHVRQVIQSAIQKANNNSDNLQQHFPPDSIQPISAVHMHLPITIGDFTDFSCSQHHVQNASEAMTGQRSLPPAFYHFPIGYAGRCSSIDISGTPVVRPLGQHWSGTPMQSDVVFSACEKMDYELELGAIIGTPVARNHRITAHEAERHIFGYVLVNDWSARDIQALEMLPLGPLNGKNAGTTLSPWIVTSAALHPFRVEPPERSLVLGTKQMKEDVPYLQSQAQDKTALGVALQVDVESPSSSSSSSSSSTEKKVTATMCRSNSSWMYWTLAQCVAHQAIGGCGLRTGDLLATGTVSGGGDAEHGCLLEFMKQGATTNAAPRGYLEDGETVTLSGYCGKGVGFGECVATLMPAREM